MARVFGVLEPTREDGVRVQFVLQGICKTDDREILEGINGLLQLVQRDSRRNVYLEIMESINAGRRVIDEGGTTTVADSGGEG